MTELVHSVLLLSLEFIFEYRSNSTPSTSIPSTALMLELKYMKLEESEDG